MRTVNLGILAHVDAGKTSLTERLLYAAGVIDAIGSVDRGGAQDERVLQSIAERMTPAIIAMGTTRDLGTRGAAFTPYGAADAPFAARLAEQLAIQDDALLAAYLDEEMEVPYCRLRDAL